MCGLLAAIIFINTTMGMEMGMGTACVGMEWRWKCYFIPMSLFST